MDKFSNYATKLMLPLFLGMALTVHAQDIRINEVMASNNHTLSDDKGDYPDWIELFNNSSAAINLSGYSITDNKDKPRKYVFPSYLASPYEYLLLFAAGDSGSNDILFWNTVVRGDDTWKYITPEYEPSATWRNTGFDDSSWLSGKGGIGYGDADDNTVIGASISIYMRKRFQLTDPSGVKNALLQIDYDDAFVAYLNGTEIARSNIGTPGTPPSFDSPSEGWHEAVMYNGGQPENYFVADIAGLLKSGENVLAVQIHNASLSSSDMSGIPYLSLQLPEKPATPPPPELSLTGNPIYTGFKLDADGDTIYLFSPAGELVDSMVILPQSPDLSFGRQPDGNGPWYIFTDPTPGKPNTTKAYGSEELAPPVFSSPGGFYYNNVQLSIAAPHEGDTIFYTTDGSEPGPGSQMYTSPIEISGSVVVRARIIKSGFLPGRVITNTYVIGRRSKLPVVCITTEPGNLWDDEYGIYVKGNNAEEEAPFFGANFWEDWERPAHVEMYEADGSRAFSIDAGIKIFGNYSRGNAQKSLAVFARKMYGAKEIDYKIFKDKPIDKFESIVLRNAGNDWFGAYQGSGSMMRDLVTTSLARDLNQDVQANRQAVVYINGEYWGIQNIREKINEHFIESNHNIDPDNINFLEGNAWVIQGSNQDYNALISYIDQHDMTQEASYEYVCSRIDMDNYMKYVMTNIFVFNGDWPGNNIRFWEPADGSGKWRWIMFDTDFGFGIWDENKVYDNTFAFALEENGEDWPNPPWSTFLFRNLMKNEKFKQTFLSLFADVLNTTFKPENVTNEIKRLSNNISNEMVYHIQRWGAPPGEWGSTYQQWYNVIRQMTDFAIKRPVVIRNLMNQMFDAGNQVELRLTVIRPEGGYVRVNTIKPDENPWTGTYLSNIPVTLTAVAEPGYRFARWAGASQDTVPGISLDISSSQSIIAYFEKIPGAPENPVVINEINYKSSPEADSEDWIELFNNSNFPTDISGWVVSDDNDDHRFVFSESTVMDSGSYLVLCRDTAAFRLVYPDVKNIQGDLGFGFSSSGEYIRVFTSDMRIEDSVYFDVTAPWPAEPNGGGYTLSLLSPDLDNLPAENWAASRQTGGTPGAENFPAGQDGINTPPPVPDILVKCYPNPFSDELAVSIDLDKQQFINISVYDLNGRKTDVITNNILSSGNHIFTWNNPHLTAGIYIIRVETTDNVKYLKVIHK